MSNKNFFRLGLSPATTLLSLAFLLIVTTIVGFKIQENQNPQTKAQEENAQGMPANDHAKGLIYDRLERGTETECKGNFKVKGLKIHGRPLCTHGPDAIPDKSQLALEELSAAEAATENSTVPCDTDGNSGKRVQVIYARASDKPDRYNEVVASIKSWAAGIDNVVNASAQQTGGERHVRFVHDANCEPVIANVTLLPDGDDDFYKTADGLFNLGYSSSSRKYLTFVDAQLYCGLATLSSDSSAGPNNSNNEGPTFARIDSQCWGVSTPSHELMHSLGAVQLDAPHGSGGYHCSQEYDRMCYQGVGPFDCDSSNEPYFDCQHDDYFSTSATPGSYLATHWNVANDSQFLIGIPEPIIPPPAPVPTLTIDSLITGKYTTTGKGKNSYQTFITTDSFSGRQTVIAKIQANLPGQSISYEFKKPDQTSQCSGQVLTNSQSVASASCTLPRNAAKGVWAVKLTNVSQNTTSHSFRVN